ncbi:MAG: hypothetical protein AAGA60_10640 [Cyanobacteria bacterium P01_E01_bin.42]
MPSQSNPNTLGIDPDLLDNSAGFAPQSDLDSPFANLPSTASNSPAPPDDPLGMKPGAARVNRLGTEKGDRFLDIASPDGYPYYQGSGAYSVGYTTNLDRDIAIAHHNNNGDLNWQYQYGGVGDDVANAIALEYYSSSDFWVTGYSDGDFAGAGFGGKDVWVGRFSPDGDIANPSLVKWGSAGDDVANAIASAISGGGTYVVGYTTGDLVGTNEGGKDAWVARFSKNGDLQWTYKIGTLGDDVATSIAVNEFGMAFVTGYSTNTGQNNNLAHEPSNAWVFALRNDGAYLWHQQMVGGDTKAYDIALSNVVGNVLITGSTTGNLDGANSGGMDVWAAYYHQGELAWIEQFGTTGDDISYDIILKESEFHLAGYTKGSMAGRTVGGKDAWLAQYDFTDPSQPEWIQQLGTAGDDVATGIAVNYDGDRYFLVGYSDGQLGNHENYGPDPIGGSQSEDMWMALYSPINQAPDSLLFRLDRPGYQQQNTLELYGEVEDPDTIYDISHIEFSLVQSDGTEIVLPEVTAIHSLDWQNKRGQFTHYFNLNHYGLEQGEYILRGMARDRAGHTNGATFEQSFRILSPLTNQAPEGLEVRLKEAGQTLIPGQTIEVEYGRVFDGDGTSNLTRIAFELIDPDGNLIQLPDATQIYTESGDRDDPYARFDYRVELPRDLQRSGQYILKATAYDGSGTMSLPFETAIDIDMNRNFSYDLNFNLNRSNYKAYEMISLQNVRLHHPDGIDKIEFVQFFLRDSNNTEIALDKVTQWTHLGDFEGELDYNINLEALGLQAGNYELFARAYDIHGRTDNYSNTQSFFVQTNPNPEISLEFKLAQSRSEYKHTEIVSISDGRIYHSEGIEDIDRIDFRLFHSYSERSGRVFEYIDIPDVAELNLQGIFDATFEYDVDLSQYDLEVNKEYSLVAIAYDELGYSSSLRSHKFYLRENRAPMGISFGLENSYLSTGMIEINDGIIHDPNGSADLDRIDFELQDANGTILDLPDVLNFTPHPTTYEEASFLHNINLGNYNLDPGSYTLIATGYDIDGAKGGSLEKQFEILSSNSSPVSLRFSLDKIDYKPTEILQIKNGWVSDPDGAQDIINIRYDLLMENGTVVASNAIDNLTAASWNPLWASFGGNINLSALNLIDGTYKIAAIAYDIANTTSNLFERSFTITTPPLNFAPHNLTFSLDRSTYTPTETLKLKNGWISDGDGAEDIESVSFKLVDRNGSEIDLGAIADFSIASWSPEWASFTGNFDLSRYNLTDGNYTLIGMARDKSGGESQTLSRAFTIETPQTNNIAPTNLQFGLSGNTFSSGNTLEITNGWISDEDGNSDLAGVEFELVAEDGTIISLEDSFDLTAATWDWSNQWSSFRHSIDFSVLGLTSGVYTIRGKAYDRAGDYSNTFSRSFTFI